MCLCVLHNKLCFLERKSPLTHHVLCELLPVLLVCVAFASECNDVFAAIMSRDMMQ